LLLFKQQLFDLLFFAADFFHQIRVASRSKPADSPGEQRDHSVLENPEGHGAGHLPDPSLWSLQVLQNHLPDAREIAGFPHHAEHSH